VTIIVGIICEDSIILASDSQTTTGTSKRTDTNKISIVEFMDSKALVAQAGSDILAGRAVEILIDLAKSKKVEDYRAVADLAQEVARKLKDELRFQQGDCTMTELRSYIDNNLGGGELLLAYYYNDTPYLYRIDLTIGLANRVNSHYTAIGCGGNLGEYLLSEYSAPGIDFNSALSTAIYVVEEVKKHDAFCSGNTRVGFIQYHPIRLSSIMDQKVIDSVVEGLSGVNENAKADRNKKISEMLKSVGEVRSRDYGTPTTSTS
jgi:20S proteasome alpha/beta subunit